MSSADRFGIVLPTRDRAAELGMTLERVLELDLGAPVVVVDNASREPAQLTLAQARAGVRLIRLDHNAGAAARNAASEALPGHVGWVVMLDDDSAPVDRGLIEALRAAPGHVAAVTADIRLPSGQREAGGLPEVPVGCAVAYRLRAFQRVGGYDASFGYYAEEYDLAAKLLARGWAVRFDPRFRVEHRKVRGGRDMAMILGRLVRNSGWVVQRYAPEAERREHLRMVIRRYREIAAKEGALDGYWRGVRELLATRRAQLRTPLTQDVWERFTGVAQARAALREADLGPGGVGVVERGKHDWCVDRALAELGVPCEADASSARVVVVGTMSPGPMLDAAERWRGRGARVVLPWVIEGSGERVPQAA